MKPALVQFPHISSYPVLLLLGFFFGWLLARSRAKRFSLAGSHLDNIALLLSVAGLFGARLFARLFYEKAPFLEALQVWKGDGLVFYGGFIFGMLAVFAYGFIRRVPLIRLADCLAPSVALGLAFGRVGCFLAGCCWGDVCVEPSRLSAIDDPAAVARIQTLPALSPPGSPFAVTFPARSDVTEQHIKLGLISTGSQRSLPVHPVQLYEAVLAAILSALLHFASRGPSAPGLASIALLLGYAFIRFCTEFFRADNKLYAGDFTFSQTVSLWMAAACLLLLAARKLIRRAPAPAAAVPYKPHPASG